MKKYYLFILIPFLLFYALPVSAAEKEERKWQEETIYSIMIDRFNDSDTTNNDDVDFDNPDTYHGGDFQGVIDQMDYIKDMGYTAIALSPFFDNEKNGYHGDWIKDFYKTDEHFGSNKTFKKLVSEAHKRDMKVIIDFVVNNVGPNHPWLKDPDKKDWFHVKNKVGNKPTQAELESTWKNNLPDLAQENPKVRNYLIDSAKWWIKETDIDGYRLDSVNYVPISFWKDFSAEVKKTKKDFFLLGEVNTDNPEYIARYKESGIDGFMDYPLMSSLRNTFKKPDQAMEPLLKETENNKSSFEDPTLRGAFMDDYETTRFTKDTVDINQHPGPRWKMALAYLYTTPGIPIVYYASEIALNGGDTPDNRRQMDFRADSDIVDFITKLGELRGKLPSLTRGSFTFLSENKGMLVYKREYKGETSVIAINNSTKSQSVQLTDKEIQGDKELRGLLAGDLVQSQDGKYTLILDRDEAEIYVLADKTGLNKPYIFAMGAVIVAFVIFIILLIKRSKRK